MTKVICYNTTGTAVADARAREAVQKFMAGEDTYWAVSTENVFYAARLLIAQKVVKPEQLVFMTRERVVRCNSKGCVCDCPSDFMRFQHDILKDILDINMKE